MFVLLTENKVLIKFAAWALASSLLTFSTVSIAYDFAAEDKLFDNRESGDVAINEARSAYEALLPKLIGTDLVYAVEQIARLDVYTIQRIPMSRARQRLPALEHCVETVARIAPSAVGETPHYYYWHVTCLALWCEANGIMQSLTRAPELVEGIEAGLRLDRTYEGGGFDRAAGSVYSKLPEWNPLGGPTGDIEKSLHHFQKSLRSPAYSGAKHPKTETGNYHFPTHYYYAQALIKDHRDDEAREVLEEAIERIDEGDLPVGREPETRLVYQLMKTLLDDMKK